MTTETQTAKMIYADANVARMILGKMKKSHPERQYTVMKVNDRLAGVRRDRVPEREPAKKPLAWAWRSRLPRARCMATRPATSASSWRSRT